MSLVNSALSEDLEHDRIYKETAKICKASNFNFEILHGWESAK